VTDNWLGAHEAESLSSHYEDLPKIRAINRFSVEVIKEWKNDLKLAERVDIKNGKKPRPNIITPVKHNAEHRKTVVSSHDHDGITICQSHYSEKVKDMASRISNNLGNKENPRTKSFKDDTEVYN